MANRNQLCADDDRLNPNRRGFLLRGTAVVGAAIGASGLASWAQEKGSPASAASGHPEVLPAEDLMREHGVLRRTLLVYDEIGRRLAAQKDFPLAALTDATQLVRKFIQDYHEKLEEDWLFPLFEKGQKLTELVKTLRLQHDAGRRVVDDILAAAKAETLADAALRAKLAGRMEAFARMYRPHAAREDTVLLPALHDLVTQQQYDRMGDEFEEREHKLLGEEGFARAVVQVAAIELSLGIEKLEQFTPKL